MVVYLGLTNKDSDFVWDSPGKHTKKDGGITHDKLPPENDRRKSMGVPHLCFYRRVWIFIDDDLSDLI